MIINPHHIWVNPQRIIIDLQHIITEPQHTIFWLNLLFKIGFAKVRDLEVFKLFVLEIYIISKRFVNENQSSDTMHVRIYNEMIKRSLINNDYYNILNKIISFKLIVRLVYTVQIKSFTIKSCYE